MVDPPQRVLGSKIALDAEPVYWERAPPAAEAEAAAGRGGDVRKRAPAEGAPARARPKEPGPRVGRRRRVTRLSRITS